MFLKFLAEVTPSIPPELYGPVAGLALALVGLALFATERIVPGSRALRAEGAAAAALKLAEDAIESQRQMAQAIEERNRLDQDRLRYANAGLLDERGEPRGRGGRRVSG